MSPEELTETIRQHELWLSSEETDGQRADLSGAMLQGADLSRANLRGAFLQGARLDDSNLRNAELVHANLRDAQLKGADLTDANLLLADFSGADLTNCDLSGTTQSKGNDLGHVNQGPRFKDANLQGAVLRKATCNRSDFSGCNLSDTNLREAVLTEANLSNLDLADLDLTKADLSQANLSKSNLSKSSLVDANLEHANLSETTLSFADVCGANLRSASLEDAKVDGIVYNRSTRFRGIRAVTCYGSSRFRRFAQDQDYVEEFKEAHPFYYMLWLSVTDCGRSIARVVVWSFAISLVFSVIYYLLGSDAFSQANAGLGWSLFTTLYYSVVTFTTLGFGDITPRTPVAAGFVMIEVIVGYVMLGILISILANKVARRS